MAPLKASLAAAALASALYSVQAAPAPGMPASSILGGAGGFVSPFIDSNGNNVPGVSGGVTTSSYFGLTTADLLTATNGNCNYMETVAFEDTFVGLNTSRWDPSSMSGMDHCTGLAPAGPSTCTAMLPSMVQLSSTFSDFNPTIIGTGLTLRASQVPCSASGNPAVDGPPSQCCAGTGDKRYCASWAGAHLVSLGCILYGTLELEAAFDMTTPNSNGLTSGAFYFTATYMVKSSSATFDPAWNEIDIGMIEGPRGLEYHTTIFSANSTAPVQTTMDAMNIDASGPVQSSTPSNPCGMPPLGPCNPKGADGSSAGSAGVNPGRTNPAAQFNSPMTFHNYKVLWTPTWTAWIVDTTVYRNITFAIWRPQSIRQILRTNVGDSRDPAPAKGPWCAAAATNGGGTAATQTCVNYNKPRPDAFVFIKRIKYTPMDSAGVYITTAINSRNSGSLPSTANPQPSLPVAITKPLPPPSVAAGRRLLDAASDIATIQAQVAASVPGLSSDQVNVTLSSYALYGYLVLIDPTGAITTDTWNIGLQSTLLAGLDQDTGAPGGNIAMVSINQLTDDMVCQTGSTSSFPSCPLAGPRASSWIDLPGFDSPSSPGLSGASAMIIEFSISGYPTTAAANVDLQMLLVDSGSGFTQTVNALNSYMDLTDTDPTNDLLFLGMLDQASAAMYAPQIQAIYSVIVTDDEQQLAMTMQALTSAISVGTCDSPPCLSSTPYRNTDLPTVGALPAATCPSTTTLPRAWYGVGIAFLIAFGVQSILFVWVTISYLVAKKEVNMLEAGGNGMTVRIKDAVTDAMKHPKQFVPSHHMATPVDPPVDHVSASVSSV